MSSRQATFPKVLNFKSITVSKNGTLEILFVMFHLNYLSEKPIVNYSSFGGWLVTGGGV